MLSPFPFLSQAFPPPAPSARPSTLSAPSGGPSHVLHIRFAARLAGVRVTEDQLRSDSRVSHVAPAAAARGEVGLGPGASKDKG